MKTVFWFEEMFSKTFLMCHTQYKESLKRSCSMYTVHLLVIYSLTCKRGRMQAEFHRCWRSHSSKMPAYTNTEKTQSHTDNHSMGNVEYTHRNERNSIQRNRTQKQPSHFHYFVYLQYFLIYKKKDFYIQVDIRVSNVWINGYNLTDSFSSWRQLMLYFISRWIEINWA